jgi:1-acyl-sn-glycerol-3-phosphate acyltransferase
VPALRPWLVTLCTSVVNFLVRALVYTFARVEVSGRDTLPRGPAILVANHLHLIDPTLVMALCPFRVHPMAKRELFETPLVGWIFWGMGAFPVRRYSADMGALRAARAFLRRGEPVLIFPEGTRSKSATIQPALPGAATVAVLSGAPIVPVAITGTEAIRVPGVFFAWLRGNRPRVSLVFGEEFALPSELRTASKATEASDYIMRRVAAMLPEAYRGAYGAGSEGTIVFRRSSEVRPSAPRRS